MDLFDSMAFWGRRFEQQAAARTGSTKFTLGDLLETFNWVAVLELTPYQGNGPLPTIKPDPVRKVKVSLLDDGVSAIHSSSQDWFEVYRTAPSGELSKVRIVAHAPDGRVAGEIRMLVGRRTFDQYFRDDPIFDAIARNTR